MKQVVRCLGCGVVTRKYGSFKVQLEETIKLMLTGEVKKETVIGQICRECGYKAGYKNREAEKAAEQFKQVMKEGKKIKPSPSGIGSYQPKGDKLND